MQLGRVTTGNRQTSGNRRIRFEVHRGRSNYSQVPLVTPDHQTSLSKPTRVFRMSSLARNVTLEQKPEMHRDVNNPWKYIQYQVMRSEKENAVAYSASLGPFFPYASVQTNGQYGYYGNIVSVPSRLLRLFFQ